MNSYTITFEFVENGRKHTTTYAGAIASTPEDAVKWAREWYGFDKDNIEVTKVTVKERV